MIVLLGSGLAAGLTFINLFENASADKEFNIFGLGALVSGSLVISLASLVIPAGYDPNTASPQGHLIRFTGAFLPALVFVIVFSQVSANWPLATFLAPFVGMAGYMAGCVIARKNETA